MLFQSVAFAVAAPIDGPLLTGAQGSAPDEPDKTPPKIGFFSWKRFQKYFDVESKVGVD